MAPLHTDPRFTIENNVLKGKVISHSEEYANIGQFILRRLEGNPGLVGQIDAVTGEEYTYSTMRDRSVRCALWLKLQGLRPRDVVALCTNDRLDYPMVCFAILYLGGILTSWDVKMNEGNFLHRMKVTKPKMVFATVGSARAVANAAKKAELELKIIVFGRLLGFFEFDEVIAVPAGVDEVEDFDCVPIESCLETALIIFTSGTTGVPKGVELSHKALGMLSRQAEAIGMRGKVCLTFSATDWITSMECILMYLQLNIPRLILSPFEDHLACATIEKYKVTWFYVIPTIINSLLKSDAVAKYDLSSLSHVFYSGNLLYIESYRALKELLGQVEITSGYATSETCGFVAIQSARSQPGSCGKVTDNARVKVIDPDTGRSLGANEKGELLLKFACMMNCYKDNAQATSKAIDVEGWLHSGDFGYYDEAGEIFVLDRLKETIYSAEHDIFPTEIEGVIWSHPGVMEVVVVGQPNPPGDDLLMAFVVRALDSTDPSKQVTEAEIIDLVTAKLPESRWLRAGVRFIDHIPKTPSIKIRRTALRELARSVASP